MKTLSSMVLGLSLSLASLAHAGPLADRAQSIADRLSNYERSIDGRDAQDIQYALDNINYLLQRYDRWQGGSQLSCISNGQTGVFEKFFITDISRNVRLGGETSQRTCQDLIASQAKGLICISNGQTGVFEKFTPFEIGTSKKIGGETALSTCKSLITSSNRQFLCVSNGQTGVFEKFSLFNRQTGSKVGGETSLGNCTSTIPR